MIALFRFLFSAIFDSFHNAPGGFSARKLSAFFGGVLAAYVTFHYADSNNAVEMVVTWLCFSLLCLGIITAQQVIELKQGKKPDPT